MQIFVTLSGHHLVAILCLLSTAVEVVYSLRANVKFSSCAYISQDVSYCSRFLFRVLQVQMRFLHSTYPVCKFVVSYQIHGLSLCFQFMLCVLEWDAVVLLYCLLLRFSVLPTRLVHGMQLLILIVQHVRSPAIN